ncbi:hypothetical protein [uncultured Mameliella sp.]|uniref:hypothetical protein n=1 Tax=uncultured Mameliella sp. TaxID=1447087 RepID=UPI002603FE82|nr:hypothetical protein [uncultured Mameliella sp.]
MEHLMRTILRAMDETPFLSDGYTWSPGLTLEAWSNVTGIAERTLKRLVNIPPIRKDVRGRGALKVMHLRVGDAVDDTPRVLAKKMGKYWDKALPKNKHTPKMFGMFQGLAKEWEPGHQFEIFKHTISQRGWYAFNGEVIGAVALTRDLYREFEENGWDLVNLWHPEALEDDRLETARQMVGEDLRVRVYKFPSVPVMRRFHYVAQDLYFAEGPGRGKRWYGNRAELAA